MDFKLKHEKKITQPDTDANNNNGGKLSKQVGLKYMINRLNKGIIYHVWRILARSF